MQIKKLSEKVTKLYRRDKSKELRKRFWHPKTQKPKIEFFSNKNAYGASWVSNAPFRFNFLKKQ